MTFEIKYEFISFGASSRDIVLIFQLGVFLNLKVSMNKWCGKTKLQQWGGCQKITLMEGFNKSQWELELELEELNSITKDELLINM